MRRFLPADRIDALPGGDRGLSDAEVQARRATFGRNDIVEKPPGGWREVLRQTAADPMIWFLAATSALFGVVGNVTEALIMIAAIGPIVGMDAFLHRRTQASTHGLKTRLAERASVIRDGAKTDVPAADLVPGDLAIVGAGQSFPADGLIVFGEHLQADESALTGEAFPARKKPIDAREVPAGGGSIDDAQWGFAGTRLLTGEARLRVVNTGGETLYGEIVRSAVHGAHAPTLLQRGIANLVATLLVVAVALCVALAWVRFEQGHGIVDALLSAVTLAVAAIPEEFPIVFSFFLGVGIFRLARRQAFVRRAVAVENIGRISCICTDKTGTLTEGRIRVASCVPADGTDRRGLLTVASLASRRDSTDPLDMAILDAAASEPAGFERIATHPFTEERRRETGVFRTSTGFVAVSKGAPETVLACCRMDDAQRESWSRRVRELADAGQKVIACASRDFAAEASPGVEPDGDYLLAGLLGCEDPVREGVVEAVRNARDAGIQVIMITGDHPSTARAVARAVGIGGDAPYTIEGDALDDTIARDPNGGLRQVDVIARALPAQKLALVRALQARGEIVAVTGDGVNDVPALQAADVGIAMGERGTRSAREVAAIVLLDDNFRTIVNAIAEGRQLFRNLRSSFAYLLMAHIPLVVTAALIPLVGYPLLYLPIHIVWLELLIHPTALLVFQELPRNLRLRPIGRRERDGRFFSAWEWIVVIAVGALVTLAVLLSYDRSLRAGMHAEHARAMALVALVVGGAACAAGLSGLRSRTSRAVVVASVSSALLLVQVPVVATLLHFEPLRLADWLVAAIAGAAPGLLASLFRWEPSRFLRR